MNTQIRLSLHEVTRDNWREALQLGVHPEQQHFVAEHVPIAAIALAKAYIQPGGRTWVPYAFYAGTAMIGFITLAYDPGSINNYWIFHFFIDQHYQGQGYGKQALHLFVQFIKKYYPQCETLQLTVHPENTAARYLYMGAGFQPAGFELGEEPVYKLDLKQH
ncbi:GCN5 family N-acetyltransferase [Dictyobacter alpinus]|uniref:GCN5 family N-acetyltransferase n=1 Tax=Dictyobacter alpinus TaxID=2014873 RepID=A0A402BFG8_9CHLR|nr:GNAT family protein [Dictyobacter alpinus]GCE30135.1 GCN5 family N-acetyltransferase [Dictyobacter alpinus]